MIYKAKRHEEYSVNFGQISLKKQLAIYKTIL